MAALVGLPQKIKEELLVCKICFSRYSTAGKLPKVLLCSHTFCQTCIQEYLAAKAPHRKFPCPMCRRDTSVPKTGTKDLPNNYTVMGLIDILDSDVNRDSPGISSLTGRTMFHSYSPGGDTEVHPGVRTTPGVPGGFCNHCGRRKAEETVSPCHHHLCRPCWQHGRKTSQGGLYTECIECRENPAPSSPHRIPLTAMTPPGVRTPAYNPVYTVKNPNSKTSLRPNTSAIITPPDSSFMSNTSVAPKPPLPTRTCSSVRFRSPTKDVGLKRQSHSFPTAPPVDVRYTGVASNYGTLPRKRTTPPKPPNRRLSLSMLPDYAWNVPLKCIKKIGRYSEARLQTSAFKQPTRVAVSQGGDIVVVDTQLMTVQVFNSAGDYISMFRVVGVQCVCFLASETLAVGTHRGVETYTLQGQKLGEDNIGPVCSTKPYKFGFIACRPKSLNIYRQSLTLHTQIKKRKTGRFIKKCLPFINLRDVAVTSKDEFILLDAGTGEIYIVNEKGSLKRTIRPSLATCGKLSSPESLDIDSQNNIFVSDTDNRRVLKFFFDGNFSRCVLNFSLNSEPRIYPYGIAITSSDNIYVTVCAVQMAEIRVYKLV